MVDLTDIVQHALTKLVDLVHGKDSEPVFFQHLPDHADQVDKAFIDAGGLPTVIFRLPTNDTMRNAFGKVHGGAIMTIIDFFSSMSQVADPRYWSSLDRLPTTEEVFAAFRDLDGVSRRIESTYVRPAPTDSEILVECKIISNSRNMANFGVRIFSVEGKLLATGLHDKIKLHKQDVQPKL